MLICCIVSHIYCHVRRTRISNATVETSQEGQYDEIGTISYNMVINDQIHNLELDNSDNASNEDERNGVLSGNGDESSNDSSVIGRPGDGYENEYQAVIPPVIECHQYNVIIPNIYQNTIISPDSVETTSAEYINTTIYPKL